MHCERPRMSFSVVRVAWEDARQKLRRVRERVFVLEQGVPAELEWDPADPHCVHLLAVAENDRPIGTARLCGSGHIGRMAVIPEWRGRGVGSALLSALLEDARSTGARGLHLNAQTTALTFYRRHGFIEVGEPFLEAGIVHRHMVYAPPERHDGAQ
jgi:predicted GNAT family N-acyltransferase